MLESSLPEKWDLADPLPEGVDLSSFLENAEVVKRPLFELVRSAPKVMEYYTPVRETIIHSIMKSSSLNMLFAQRGVGKTWIALNIARSIATGTPFLVYDVPKPRGVLFIDGEMPASDIRERLKAMGAHKTENLFFLLSEIMHLEDRPLNIHDKADQDRILGMLEDLEAQGHKIEVIIFDNLSSLSLGVDENDNTQQEAFLRWLISLRHRGYAILLVHHAGKSGDQRGASRREDMLDTVIKLEKDKDAEPHHIDGAHFVLSFTKTRGETPKPASLILTLMTGPDGLLEFSYTDGATVPQAIKVLKTIHEKNPKSGKELAAIMGVSTGAISQARSQLVKWGYLDGVAKGLIIMPEGYEKLAKTWPTEYADLIKNKKEEDDACPF